MELKKITNHCYYSTPSTYGMRPSLGYIEVSKDIRVMVNAGNSVRHMKDFLNLLSENNLIVPNKGLLTTSRWNHSFGLQYLTSDKPNKLVSELGKDASITFKCIDVAQRHIAENNSEFLKKTLYLKSSASPFNTLKSCNGFTTEEVANIKGMNEEYLGNFDSIRIAVPEITSHKKYSSCNFAGLDITFITTFFDRTCDAALVYVKDDKVIYGGDFLHSITCNIPQDDASRYLALKKIFVLQKTLEDLDFEYFISSYEAATTKEEVLKSIDKFTDLIICYKA